MVNRSDPDLARQQALSCLMDGELPLAETADALAAWGHDGELRERWHAYHLIADVLRSDDLASQPAADERFLQALRLRLADEPVPMATVPMATVPITPAPVRLPARPVADTAAQAMASGQRSGGGRWWLSAGLAAGLMAALGLTLLPQLTAPTPSGASLVAMPAVPAPATGTLVRDARLDRYLAAHRNLANNTTAAGGAEHRVQIVFEGR